MHGVQEIIHRQGICSVLSLRLCTYGLYDHKGLAGMEYIRADVFPEDLLREIQKYAQGKLVYIPKPKAAYKKWGDCSGSRELYTERNHEIKRQFQDGKSIEELAEMFYLSIESVKKIIYKK